MKKISLIFFYLIVITNANTQSISIVFEDDISIDSINKTMISNKIPLLFEEEDASDTVATKIFYNGLYIAQTYSNLTHLLFNKHRYWLFFYDYAGYDRILFINEKDSSIYYSDKFNYSQAGQYKYFLKKKHVKILYLETETKEFVPVNRCEVSKDHYL